MSSEGALSEVGSHQTTHTLLMVSPNNFKFNKDTAKNNSFQKDLKISNDIALEEFNTMVEKLRQHHVKVLVMPSRENVETPDSIFPNNWFSVHSTQKQNDKILVLYPMCAENRRLELQPESLIKLLKKEGINVSKTVDLSTYANDAKFLEGTGSLVLDRENKIAYAAISPRTDAIMLTIFAERMNYKLVVFHSFDENNQLIYHTNVILSVGSHFAVIALDSISDERERATLVQQLQETHKEIVPISQEQVKHMAGNVLQVKDKDGKAMIIMSQSAHNAFTPEQRNILNKYGQLIPVQIENIETVGGGSARCMLAEIF